MSDVIGLDRYRDALPTAAEPAWLVTRRRAALDGFLAKGFPGPRDEAWKHTSLEKLARSDLHAVTAIGASPYLDRVVFPGIRMVFVDGLFSEWPSMPPHSMVGPLSLRLRDEPAYLERRLGRVAEESGHALTALNSALWRDGAWIEVPADTTIAAPIHLVFTVSESDAMIYPRVLIELGPGASATVIEDFAGGSAASYWCNSVTEVVLHPGARLTHIKLTEEAPAASHIGRIAVRQMRDSHYFSLSVSLDGNLVRHDIETTLAEPGASCRLDGLFVATDRSHVDHHTRIDHAAVHTTSREDYRGIAAGRGRGVFNGRVLVQPGAQKSDAVQSSRNLLLSKAAEIDTMPQLEIYADDVKCAHGATVGRLDEDQVFYLRSRGIAEAQARGMLTWAFAAQALAGLADGETRTWLESRIARVLPGGAAAMDTVEEKA